jgi:hypothetical protein
MLFHGREGDIVRTLRVITTSPWCCYSVVPFYYSLNFRGPGSITSSLSLRSRPKQQLPQQSYVRHQLLSSKGDGKVDGG